MRSAGYTARGSSVEIAGGLFLLLLVPSSWLLVGGRPVLQLVGLLTSPYRSISNPRTRNTSC